MKKGMLAVCMALFMMIFVKNEPMLRITVVVVEPN